MAETSFKDTVTANSIKSLMGEGIKVINIRDAIGRTVELYEAPLIIEIGNPCMKTVYKFKGGAAGTSNLIIAWEESVVAWPGYELLQAGAGDDITALP